MVNEDTQGNVTQLQAEVKRLKEQLAQLTAGQMLPESLCTVGKMSSVSFKLRRSRCGCSMGDLRWQAQHCMAIQISHEYLFVFISPA